MSKLTRFEEGHAVHRVGHPRDDAPRASPRRGQPVAGIPGLPGTGRDQGGGLRGHPRRCQPVRGHLGRARAARGDRRASSRAATASRSMPDEQVTVCCGATEAMMATLLAIVDPGDEVIVFEPFYENYGPDAILSGAVPRFVTLHEPDWQFDPDELAGGVQPTDARHHHQHAEQPDRQGVLARGADDDRAALPALGRHRDHRRDLRAHHLRRPRARADGRDRRHGRSHRHDQQPVEDVQRDRLAGGLGDLAAGAHRRDPQGARLPDRRRAGAAAAGGRGGTGVAGLLLHGARRGRTAAPRRAGRDPRASPVPLLRAGRRVLRHDRHQRVWLSADDVEFARTS